MLLGFSQSLKGKPTYFDRKILLGMYLNEKLCAELSEVEIDNAEYFLQQQQLKPKLHTLRTDAHNRWKPGMLIHMVYVMRTKQCKRIAPVVACTSVQEVEIRHNLAGGISVFVDGKGFYFRMPNRNDTTIVDDAKVKMTAMAHNDGFESIEEFFDYFNTTQKLRLIHWTNLKY